MSEKVTLFIDGREIEAIEGEKLLWVALENSVFIPHLCAVKEQVLPFAACRLCFVEVEGKPRPVTACTEPISRGMRVKTRSEDVDRLVRAGFELIMSNHHTDCKNCPGNGACALQKIARERKIPLRPRNLARLEQNLPVDDSKEGIVFDPNKCVLCGRCVPACRENGTGVIGLAHRGFDRRLTTFGDIPLGETACNGCGACVDACPVGARGKTGNN